MSEGVSGQRPAGADSGILPADLRHREVRSNGIRLHVAESGPETAPAVILLHGFPEFWYAWKEQIGPLREAGYRVLAVDQRGFNLSEKPRGIAAYRTHHLVADVVGLLDALGLEQVALVAHDWGAHVAWSVAEAHPQRLRKLVILNVAHPQVMTRNILFNPRQAVKSWYVFALQIPYIPEWILSARDFERVRESIRWQGEKGSLTAADEQLYVDAWSRDGAFTTMVNWYRGSFWSWPRLAKPPPIRVPTLVLWGKRDPFLEESMAQQSVDLCEDARLVIFDEGTHWIHHEVPSAVNKEILAFLGPPS